MHLISRTSSYLQLVSRTFGAADVSLTRENWVSGAFVTFLNYESLFKLCIGQWGPLATQISAAATISFLPFLSYVLPF